MDEQTDGRTSGVTRRTLVGLAGAGAAGALVPNWASANAATERPFRALPPDGRLPPPNILVILADDLGWADLSCYGSPEIRTPNLDALAASGVRFTDSYSASAVCSPTRFGLYTGRYPGRLQGGLAEAIGVHNAVDGLPEGQPTLASLLKGTGYDTAMIGKWHCGGLPWFSPTRVGWDEFFGNFSGGLDYFSKLGPEGQYDLYEGEVAHEDLRYYTTILTERAVDFVLRGHHRPWLLNLNFTTPHWPWEGPGDKAVSDELSARIRAGENAVSVMFHYDGGSLAKFKEMVEDLDRSVGEVLAALTRSGQRENTLVLFASDNGGERFSFNWPFSGEKASLLEGGVRIPTVLSWPGRVRPHQVSHEPVITMDWTATLLELGGAEPPPGLPLDGLSLAPYLFRGQPRPQRDLFWRFRSLAPGRPLNRALRRGNLKYLRPDNGLDYLYDLAADPRERANLATKRPQDLAALRQAWDAIAATLLPYST